MAIKEETEPDGSASSNEILRVYEQGWSITH
jgi:hypothetical protein